MRTSLSAVWLSLGLLGAGALVSGAARADNILITNQSSRWRLGTNPPVSPLPVEVKKGDVIEFKPVGAGHGVVTLDKPGDDKGTSEALPLVLACGQDAASKPSHVLREVECGAASQFNTELAPNASMKLEVTDMFKGDVHFWCIFHTEGMWGTFKLKT